MQFSFFRKLQEKRERLIFGFILLLALSLLFYYQPLVVKEAFSFLNHKSYDTTVRFFAKPLKADNPITIVDIDDRSLDELGRWPWSRNVLAELVENLYKGGALVVALGVLFSGEEDNLVSEVIETLQKKEFDKDVLALLEKESILFDYDKQFAEALAKGSSLLPFIFGKFHKSLGVLPEPMLTLTESQVKELPLEFYPNYLSNIALLGAAATTGGFINASVDSDGIVRYAPLLMGHDNKLYGSLGFAASSVYLLEDQVTLDVKNYPNQVVIEAVHLGNTVIPTDALGRMLIPFRGRSYSFPYISATDVLHHRVDAKAFVNRLIFIGSSASGWKDVFPTAIDPIFPGAEIHASIAAGIIDHYLPYQPAWEKGLLLLLILCIGILFVLFLPFLGALASTLIMLFTIAGLILLQILLWTKLQLFVSVVIPVLVLFLLYLFQEILGYFTETRRKKELKEVFGQYVPVQHIDRMMHAKNILDLEGENKELTVLFSDIRNFTAMSEKLTAPEIKHVLNDYLTPMTQVIFEHMGTIDKYVGDMIMAFWGAPLQDEQHPLHAVQAALAMQKKLQELNAAAGNKLQIHIGIGINTGLMNVGDMGSKFRRAYTVLGDVVNTASRMESITKFYHVGNIIAESTVEKTKEHILYRKLDKVLLKGKQTPTFLFEALCDMADADSAMLQVLDLHHRALELYWQKKWQEAEKLFVELRERVSERKEYYDLFLARIKSAQESPLPEDWQGVFILEAK